MRYFQKLCGSLLILSLFFAMSGRPVLAAEEEYTYTVRLYAGNQGTLTGDGISVPAGAEIRSGQDEIVIRGLKYGDTVYITPQAAASAADEKYYVRGVRRSGRDNSEATESSFRIASDRDYVIAYGIKGDMVAYTVNYLDADGNRLLASDTYYGVVGERQYVSARYVDGYQPQALNLVKTLSGNEAENVFDFQYSQAQAGGGAAADAGAGEAGDAGGAVGGDLMGVPDEDVPLSDNLRDLDDEDVPLAGAGGEQAGVVMGYLPVYVGIGAVAVSALLLTAVYLKKRQRAAAVPPSDDKERS